MKAILQVEKISKKYRIQHLAYDRLTFRERILTLIKFERKVVEDFWALDDVSFDIYAGESFGIIGRNGAGKSTLLKILSRITSPTNGRFISRGRIASLLEVGTGFHPELTGRENVFFNGSLLGMKREEIVTKFDAIVDFSGVEKFLDTPLKHYSSGMQLRLAFAVAAFLEPEILVIDEVLAVGDAEFQKKCLGKMEDVSRSGRTIIFVSHNLTALESLCTKAIWLHQGKMKSIGETTAIITEYLSNATLSTPLASNELFGKNRSGSGEIRFVSFRPDGQDGRIVPLGKATFYLELVNKGPEKTAPTYFAISVFDEHRAKLMTFDNLFTEQKVNCPSGKFSIACTVPSIGLMPGKYHVDLWCASHFETYDNIEEAGSFSVEVSDIYNTGKVHNRAMHGYYITPNNWINPS